MEHGGGDTMMWCNLKPSDKRWKSESSNRTNDHQNWFWSDTGTMIYVKYVLFIGVCIYTIYVSMQYIILLKCEWQEIQTIIFNVKT